jgi:hypothetical protein
MAIELVDATGRDDAAVFERAAHLVRTTFDIPHARRTTSDTIRSVTFTRGGKEATIRCVDGVQYGVVGVPVEWMRSGRR